MVKRKTALVLLLVLVVSMVFSAQTSALAAPAQSSVTITHEMQVVDSFNGVNALYRPGECGNDHVYSCAAFVTRYYREIYGIGVHNLLKDCTPGISVGKGHFLETGIPEPGDIGYHQNSGGSGHWFIIKEVNDDGSCTIIEQNWKKSESATVNRVVTKARYPSLKFFRWSEKNDVPTPVFESVTIDEIDSEHITVRAHILNCAVAKVYIKSLSTGEERVTVYSDGPEHIVCTFRRDMMIRSPGPCRTRSPRAPSRHCSSRPKSAPAVRLSPSFTAISPSPMGRTD